MRMKGKILRFLPKASRTCEQLSPPWARLVAMSQRSALIACLILLMVVCALKMQPPGGGIHLKGSDRKPMPRMGFGTCCRASAKGEPLIASILEYLSQGGRLIDTAQMYENHRDVAAAIERSGIPRAELWITSKVRTIDTSLSRSATVAEVRRGVEPASCRVVQLRHARTMRVCAG